VAFFVVYIKEAHPEDGWVLSSNRGQGIAVTDPVSDDERSRVATVCSLQLDIRMPVLLDTVTDRVARAYGAWPDRLYLIGRDGRVAWQGGPGPSGSGDRQRARTLARRAALQLEEALLALHAPRIAT
jgi:hypothetical protein